MAQKSLHALVGFQRQHQLILECNPLYDLISSSAYFFPFPYYLLNVLNGPHGPWNIAESHLDLIPPLEQQSASESQAHWVRRQGQSNNYNVNEWKVLL